MRVLIVDDQDLARQGLRSLLEAEGFDVAGEFGSARDASRRFADREADVAVVDAQLPDGTGIEVCRNVRSVGLGLQCLLLTSYVDEEVLRAVVLAGAAGYVLRQLRSDRIVEAIRRAAAGEPMLSPAAVQRVRSGLIQTSTNPLFEALSRAERDVLVLMAEGKSNGQICDSLILDEQTVRGLIAALLCKLGFGEAAWRYGSAGERLGVSGG